MISFLIASAEVTGMVFPQVPHCGQGGVVFRLAMSGLHWTKKEVMSLSKARWLTQGHTAEWTTCLLTKVHVVWITLSCSWTTSVFLGLCVSPFWFRATLGPLAKVADCIFRASIFLSLDPFGSEDADNAQFLWIFSPILLKNLMLSSKALC